MNQQSIHNCKLLLLLPLCHYRHSILFMPHSLRFKFVLSSQSLQRVMIKRTFQIFVIKFKNLKYITLVATKVVGKIYNLNMNSSNHILDKL